MLRSAARRANGLTAALGFAVSLIAASSSACRPAAEEGPRALAELERLAFVPAGEALFESRLGPRIVCGSDVPLLVDRFEVPRGEWRRFAVRARMLADPLAKRTVEGWGDETDSLPATWLALDDALEYAASRGMRVPSASEWIWIASGSRAQPYPWGPSRASRVANTAELQLGRPVAVGTFELGRTPAGVYDLTGNVWEWVSKPLPAPGGRELDATLDAWVLGGSYATPLARTSDIDVEGRVAFLHLDVDERTRAEDIGCRCVVDARAYLRARAAACGESPGARARLVALGVEWGRDARVVLEALAAEPDAPPAIHWLLEGARR